MQVLNRSGLTAGRKLKVSLKGQICTYNNTLAMQNQPQDVAYGIKFEAFGLTAAFAPDYYGTAPMYVTNNPKWHIYDDLHSAADPLLVISGFDAELTIEVAPADFRELVDIDFDRDTQTGEYIWRGLPESGLPNTIYTPSYSADNAWTGTVNGTAFHAVGGSSVSLALGTEAQEYVYDISQQHGTGGDACSASVEFSEGLDFVKTTRTYSAAMSRQIYDDTENCSVEIKSTGSGMEMTLVHPHVCSVTPQAVASISSWPFMYNYTLTDRNGRGLSGTRFSDVNGKTWSGGTSADYEYDGVQTVTARGGWTGDTKSVSPAFNVTDGWQINDPAPQQVGGVTCLNPERSNTYSVTIRDPETETETTYRPDRVLLYAPLGDTGDLAGDLTLTETTPYLLDNFQSGWTASGGTWSSRYMTASEEGASVTKTGFIRAPYDAETDDGTLTAAELVPHLPHHSIIRVDGSFPDLDTDLILTISAKGKRYRFRPYQKTATSFYYDLTKPMLSWWHKDRTDTLYDAWKWERYKTKGETAEYIDEDPQDGLLSGPVLFSDIKIEGFNVGERYRLTAFRTIGSGTLYYFAGLEFAQPRECGTRGDEEAPDVTIYRNRHLVIMRRGRFAETFSNQKSVTDMGYVFWHFPTTAELTNRTGGDKLVWPRDDYDIMQFSGTAPVGGSPAPVEDMVSTAAYIGWIEADSSTTLKIKPVVDYINVDTRLYDGKLELKGFTDLMARWQGFVNDSGDTVTIGTRTSTNTQQFRTAYTASGIAASYESGGQTIFSDSGLDSIPGFLHRYAVRRGNEPMHGFIWRNAAGKILRNALGVILRGDYNTEERET
ncbi:MAG: hypothetical protein J5758_04825 [Abditibacteriota bacterium]|nr:hypothetical protein [Abditibacteriota bacterium]